MNANARSIITAALTAAATVDPTITAELQQAALDTLDGVTAAGLTNPEPMPRILNADTVAELTGLDKRSLRTYAAKGQLRRAYFGGDGKRAKGYTEESVRAFIAAATRQSANGATA